MSSMQKKRYFKLSIASVYFRFLSIYKRNRPSENVRRSLCDLADSFRDVSRFFRSLGEVCQEIAEKQFSVKGKHAQRNKRRERE